MVVNKSISKKVFVGLSGGVDSAVSAALLKKEGYDVTGVYIRTWQPDWLPCTWREERRDAMRVAAKLDIPFTTINLSNEYKQKVADYMIEEYRQGRTPNPDIMCNKEIKFGSFLSKARSMGADFIATGHYAQNIGNNVTEGADNTKDQSYFLWTLNKDQLSHVLFPVGHLQKTKVRKLAKKFALPNADKKDSQGICFLGKVDMKEFLSHYIEQKTGNVVNEKGEIIGSHEGVWFYTIGERHGFSIFEKTDHDKPYYVAAKDIEKNQVIVTEGKHADSLNNNSEHATSSVILSNVYISDSHIKITEARIRYRQQKQKCVVENKNGVYEIKFEKIQEGLSAGQSIVFYNGKTCLGGGVIEKVLV